MYRRLPHQGFSQLSRFLPILLPTENRGKYGLHGDLRLIAKIVRDLDIEVLRRADVGVTEPPSPTRGVSRVE